jgi:hypothetical protein
MVREGHRLLSQQVKWRLCQIERDPAQITGLVDTIIAADEDLRTKADILASIPLSRRCKHVLPSRGHSQSHRLCDPD